jgi:hypothetical protein
MIERLLDSALAKMGMSVGPDGSVYEDDDEDDGDGGAR